MKGEVIVACVVMALGSRVAFPCSLQVEPMLAFDEEEYVFLADVVGIIGPLGSTHSPVFGFLARIEKAVHVPEPAQPYYAVCEMSLEPDCSYKPLTEAGLLEMAPLGSQVEVVARLEADLASPSGLPTLVVKSPYHGTIHVVQPEQEDTTFCLASQFAHYQVEFRTQLLALQSAGTPESVRRILGFLATFPPLHELNYNRLAEKHAAVLPDRIELMRKREIHLSYWSARLREVMEARAHQR